jgi:hypothetical protein
VGLASFGADDFFALGFDMSEDRHNLCARSVGCSPFTHVGLLVCIADLGMWGNVLQRSACFRTSFVVSTSWVLRETGFRLA